MDNQQDPLLDGGPVIADDLSEYDLPAMPKRPRGRPRKNPEDLGKRPNVTLRVRQVIYDQVKAAAKANGRSLSEEMEARIEAALAIEDIRDILREELGPRRLAYPDLRWSRTEDSPQ